ncbi:MAG TPA: tetratricopeptide repeat protein, partial [Thermoanaerobaculia bacterium]|nr:tetratricopeptide repeat protein [Thermoanaerobaculia bacterium]
EAAQVVTELNAELAKPEPVLPGDSLLILLAHAYEAQGNETKSREAYRRITTEFPESPYVIEAQRRVGA